MAPRTDPPVRSSQAIDVACMVRDGKCSLSEAVLLTLGGITDFSGPKPSHVADDAMLLLAYWKNTGTSP